MAVMSSNDIVTFPLELVRNVRNDTAVKKLLNKYPVKTKDVQQPVILVHPQLPMLRQVAAFLLREYFLKIHKGVVEVPLFNSMLLVQELLEDFRVTKTLLIKSPAIVIEDQTIEVPFISRPDSYILDRIHYGYTLITAIIDQRANSLSPPLKTIILAQELPPFIPTCMSLAPFVNKTARVKAMLWIPNQEPDSRTSQSKK